MSSRRKRPRSRYEEESDEVFDPINDCSSSSESSEPPKKKAKQSKQRKQSTVPKLKPKKSAKKIPKNEEIIAKITKLIDKFLDLRYEETNIHVPFFFFPIFYNTVDIFYKTHSPPKIQQSSASVAF